VTNRGNPNWSTVRSRLTRRGRGERATRLSHRRRRRVHLAGVHPGAL